MDFCPLHLAALACALAAATLAASCGKAVGRDADITAAAFGDIYDMSDGALPIGKGGSHKGAISGDTWYSTWAADDTAFLVLDDGNGFNNANGTFWRHCLCRLEGDPNLSTDGFRGVNLNPGPLGETIPNHVATPEWRLGYTSSIHAEGNVLYEVRHNWSPSDALWPPIDSSVIKSPDGGKTWVNHLGQVNAPLPDKDHAMFPQLPWSWLTFYEYGRGGAVPNADNADKYVYLVAGSVYLARVPRAKLADLNRADFQYYRGGELDGMLDSSWSDAPNDGKPMLFEGAGEGGKIRGAEGVGLSNVVFNAALGRYVGTGWGVYFAPGEAGHDKGKARFIIYTAVHPWGPWAPVLRQGIWGRAGWNFLLCNKFATADGLKTWYVFCGEYKGDTWNYGMQYMPVYLSAGPVDAYEAEKAALQGPRVAAEYPDFSGAGYVTGFAKTGDKASFTLAGVRGTGWHIVRIRYTSPEANGGTLSIYVNGKKARRVKLSLNDKGGPVSGHWVDRGDIYYLRDGANTFEIRQDDGDAATGVMIDAILVSRDPTHDEGRNVAPEATATASSGDAAAAVKGCADGLGEWAAKPAAGEWIRLDWAAPGRTIQKVILYDRANMKDQVVSGTLTFSDGSSVPVGKLQNDGQAGTVVTFPPRTVRWVQFTVGAVRPGTENAGLGEIEVFAAELQK